MSDDPRINLLDEHFSLNPNPHPNPWIMGKYFVGTLIIGALTGAAFSFIVTHTQLVDAQSGRGFFRSFTSFVTSSDRPLEGEDEDRVNMLVMGIGGKGHEGPELTDTLMFGSYQPSTKSVGLLSIPRDLTIPLQGYGWRKVNHANYFGELERTGDGAAFAARTIGNVLAQPIHYYVKIDFQGFEDFIDALGGVDIYVERGFIDTQYPTGDGFVQTIVFKDGWERMNGARALMYARSRHGTNGEGSDFARASRQQSIILAIKERLVSPATVLNPARITELVATVRNNVTTNISTWELLRMARYARDVHMDRIQHVVLDTSPESPLYETTMNGAYVILPKNDDWSAVERLADNLVAPDHASVGMPTATPAATPHARIALENGTSINGFAFRTSQLLESQGFDITNIANASTRDFDHTIIYDMSDGAYPRELKALQDYLKADVATTMTGWLFSTEITPRTITLDDEGLRDGRTETQADFLVILGQNSAHLVRQ